MNGSVLTIGGSIDADTARVYRNPTELTFTDAASSLSSWSATLPVETELEAALFDEIYIYHNDAVLFRGELESFDTNYGDGTTTVSGRGILVTLDRRTQRVTYTDTTVYEALKDAWASTPYEATILPPNRGAYNELFASGYELGGFVGHSYEDARVIDGDVVVRDNTLEFQERSVDLDDTLSNTQAATVRLDSPATQFGLIVETTEPIQDLKVTLKDRYNDGRQDPYENEEVVIDTVSHTVPQRYHVFDYEFSSPVEYLRPAINSQDEVFAIKQIELFSIDPTGFTTIDELEIDGTQFEVLQELHDLGAYEFTVRDYDTVSVASFPVGTLGAQPSWRTIESTRKIDYTDYANRVTVHGETLSDGSVNTATKTDADEVARLNDRGVGDDGVIERFEKNPELTTQAEVASRAERLLAESVSARRESGSVEIAPTHVAPGYSYSIGSWGDAFPYGGQLGTSSLYFDGDGVVESDWGSSDDDYSNGGTWTFSFNIHPQALDTLGDDAYQVLLHFEDDLEFGEFATGFVRVYGDGSVAIGTVEDEETRTRTEPNVVTDGQAQRLTVVWGRNAPARTVYVDGILEATFSEYASAPLAISKNRRYWIGNDSDGSHGYVGGMDDIRLWINDAKQQDWIREHYDTDIINAPTTPGFESNISDDMGGYIRCNDFTTPNSVTVDGVAQRKNNIAGDVSGAAFQDNVGQLEEVRYSLGRGDTMTLDFDIRGRLDTELLQAQRASRSNRRLL
jgi:hypothetical protein